MRHFFAFIGSLLIHGTIVSLIYYYLNKTEERKPEIVTEAISFDLGMLVSNNQSNTVQPQQMQASQAKNSLESQAQPEPMPEPEPVAEPEPEVEPEPKPISKPIVKPIVKKPVKKEKPKVKKPKKKKVKKKPIKKKQIKKKKTKPQKRVSTKKQIASKKSVGINDQKVNSLKNTGAATASKGGQGSSNASNKANANSYRAGLQRAIARIAKRNYPRAAKRMRKQGTVKVQFSLGRDGTIGNVSVIRSSGNSSLDRAAVKSMKRLRRYKAPPSGFPNVLTVPIRFNLR